MTLKNYFHHCNCYIIIIFLTCFMSSRSPHFSQTPDHYLLEIREYNTPADDVISGKISETPGHYWKSTCTPPPSRMHLVRKYVGNMKEYKRICEK